MGNAITLTQENFKTEVLQSEIPVLVDYWAPWCGPCRAVAPILEEIAAEREGQLKLGKVNVDEELALAEDAGVFSIPYLVLYRGGAPVAKIAGALPKRLLERQLGLDSPYGVGVELR